MDSEERQVENISKRRFNLTRPTFTSFIRQAKIISQKR